MGTREEIPYLQATMYYFVYYINTFLHYINTFLTRRSQLYSSFKKRIHCRSFIALDRMIDVSAANWRSQPHKIIVTFHVWRYSLFQGVELPFKHYSSYNKVLCWYLLPFLELLERHFNLKVTGVFSQRKNNIQICHKTLIKQ